MSFHRNQDATRQQNISNVVPLAARAQEPRRLADPEGQEGQKEGLHSWHLDRRLEAQRDMGRSRKHTGDA